MNYKISQQQEHAQEVSRLLATPDGFRSWLKHHHTAESVGQAQTPGNDPIGNYLKDNLGTHFCVSSQITTPQGLDLESPGWVVEFSLQLDERFDLSVKASEALEVLESLNYLDSSAPAEEPESTNK